MQLERQGYQNDAEATNTRCIISLPLICVSSEAGRQDAEKESRRNPHNQPSLLSAAGRWSKGLAQQTSSSLPFRIPYAFVLPKHWGWLQRIDPGSVGRKKTKVSLNGGPETSGVQWPWTDLERQTETPNRDGRRHWLGWK